MPEHRPAAFDDAALDSALERLLDAAHRHLAAVKAASGRVDDDAVWQRYVELNNSAVAYDELLMDAFGEVTPWDLEPIDPQEADEQFGVGLGGMDGGEAGDQTPVTVSVRQRRDYLVPSVAALLRVAEAARRVLPAGVTPSSPEPATEVGGAVTELLEAGDGSLGSLDIPELEPLAGVTLVCEVTQPVDVDALAADGGDPGYPFAITSSDSQLRVIVERPYLPSQDESDAQ